MLCVVCAEASTIPPPMGAHGHPAPLPSRDPPPCSKPASGASSVSEPLSFPLCSVSGIRPQVAFRGGFPHSGGPRGRSERGRHRVRGGGALGGGARGGGARGGGARGLLLGMEAQRPPVCSRREPAATHIPEKGSAGARRARLWNLPGCADVATHSGWHRSMGKHPLEKGEMTQMIGFYKSLLPF